MDVRYALLALVGRQLFSIIFILASAGHFSSQTTEAAASHGVPLADLLVPLSGVMALMGGLSVLLGYRTRFGALLLVLFLVPVTLVMHNFWSAPDAMAHELQKVMFMMIGGGAVSQLLRRGPVEPGCPVERLAGLVFNRNDSNQENDSN
jgi:putative oxidoreductase